MRKKSLILAAAILAFAQPGANAESRMSALEVPDAPHMPETREITDTLRASSAISGTIFKGLYTFGFASLPGVMYRRPFFPVFSS